jgi:hypothetical protein
MRIRPIKMTSVNTEALGKEGEGGGRRKSGGLIQISGVHMTTQRSERTERTAVFHLEYSQSTGKMYNKDEKQLIEYTYI